MTEEQNDAIVRAEVDAHFRPKPATPLREKVPEEKIDHFIRMAKPPAPKHVDSDYERQIRKAHRARLQKRSELELEPTSSCQKMRENRSLAGRTGGAIDPTQLLCQKHMRVRTPNIIVGKPFTFPSWAMG